MKKTFITAILICLYSAALPQVAINRDGSPPDSSAMFEIKSDSLGFLPPRMSAAQINSIQNPIPGMIIYNTTTHSLDFLTSISNMAIPQWTRIDENGVEKTEPLFQVIYGDTMNDYFKDIIQTSDGGYLAVGTFEVADNYYIGNKFDYLLAVKLKPDGTLDENFNASNSDYGNFASCYFNSADWNNGLGKTSFKETKGETVIETHNGCYLLGGFFYNGTGNGSSTGDYYAIKLTSKGIPDRGGFGNNANIGFGANTISSDEGKSIIETLDGGYAYAGYSSNWSYGGQAKNCQIVKLTNNGDIDGSFNSGYGNIVFSTDGDDVFNSIIQTSDTGYLAVGQLGIKYLFAVKLKSNGTLDPNFNNNGMLILEDSTNISSQDHSIMPYDVKETPDGGFLICGDCKNVPEQDYTLRDAFVIKITSTGYIDQTFADNGILIFGAGNNENYNTYAYSLVSNKEGGFAITGKTDSHESNGAEYLNTNVFVAKFNSHGLVDTDFGYYGHITIGTDTTKEVAYSIKQTSDDGYIVAGTTTLNQSNGNTSGFIAKISPDGDVCSNGGHEGTTHTGMRFKISTVTVAIDHGGTRVTDIPKYYHRGSITTVCNQ